MSLTDTTYKTTCCYCGVGCGMLVKKEPQGKISVEGDPQHPVNKGMLCSKGLNLHHAAMDTSDRLLYPLFREHIDDPFVRVSWENAMDNAADRFKRILHTHGPDAVGFYVSGQCLTEEYYLANKLVKGFIGTNNIDTNSRLCMSSAVSAYKLALGEDSVPGCYEDIELANTFLIAGANPAWCHPILFRRIEAHKAKNEQVKIIVVDPRRTQTAALADLHLQIKPGTDIILFHAIARGLIENGFIDESFIRDHTTGFEALRDKVMQRSLQDAAALCDIRFTDIYRAVKYIGLSGGFISMWAMGLNQSIIGVNKNLALINLSLITGKIGKPGSGPFSLTGQTNAMGGREVGGMATLSSAHRDLSNPEHRHEIAAHWKVSDIPATPGLTATEMFSALREGKMKALWIVCTNPLVSIPNSLEAEAALRQAEFVVVQDMSMKADTLSFAHLALPAATWLEKEGTVTNSERRISHLEKVIEAPGQALPDTEILSRFAKAMGWADSFSYDDAAAIYREHAALTRGTRIDISQLDYPAIKEAGSMQWPVNGDSRIGTPRLFTDHRFYHSDGRAKIHAVPEENLSEPLSQDFPLVLTTGRIRDQWHTMTRSGKVNKLRQHIPFPLLEIHPRDASQRNIGNGDPVIITSKKSEVQVTAHISDQQKRGTVFLPMHWGKMAGRSFARVNNLTTSAIDPISKQPDFKYTAVQVTRYERQPQKIIIAGESDGVPIFINRLRELGLTDDIRWICRSGDEFFYSKDELIDYFRSGNTPPASGFNPQTEVLHLEVTVLQGHHISMIDTAAKMIKDDGGSIHDYDELILAPIVLSRSEQDTLMDEVIYYRDKRRIFELMEDIQPEESLLLIGNEPALSEAAVALAERKLKVYVHFEGHRIMEDILDERAATLLEDIMLEAGVELIKTEGIQAILEFGQNKKVVFDGGRYIICKAIISFDGARPELGVLKAAGINIDNGIPVNEFLQTNDPSIFAFGELARYKSEIFPGRAATQKQAQCLANYFHGDLSQYYDGSLPYYSWSLSASSNGDETGYKISVIGDGRTGDMGGDEEVFFLDRRKRIYKKCGIRDDRIIGAIFIGEQAEEPYYRNLIQQRTELDGLREKLLRPEASGSSVTKRVICSCMQIGEKEIMGAIADGCKTVAELGVQLGAGTKCGSCKPELQEILKKS